MNEILMVFVSFCLLASGILCGFLIFDRLDRRTVQEMTKKAYDDLKDIANKLQMVHNENVVKMLELQDKVNALEFRVKGK